MSNTAGKAMAIVNAAALRGIGLFDGLETEAVEALARQIPSTHAEVGSLIIAEGDDSREMFVVITGELEVFKHGRGGNDLRVALLGPGDWFGDMSMVDPQPRSASVRAIAPSLLLRISPDQLETTLIERDVHTYAILMRNLARELSRRLRVADGILAQMVVSVGEAYRGPSTSGR